MFIKNIYYLATTAVRNKSHCVGSFELGLLYSRETRKGILLKDSLGDGLEIRTKKSGISKYVVLHSYQDFFGEVLSRVIALDRQRISDRLVSYIESYYGERKTNCSTLVEYLRNGKFAECCPKSSYFSFSGGMNRYTGQSVVPGDSLCILYYRKKAKSRKAPLHIRSSYKKAAKKTIKGDLCRLKGHSGTYSPKQLLELYRSGYFHDYHFMFCIGTENGRPVFIQQQGYHDPSLLIDPKTSPIIVSHGMMEINDEAVPGLLFIKKGRG